MNLHAISAFEIESWEEETYDERRGESTAELLMAHGPEERAAACVGFECIAGSVNGRQGSFVLHPTAAGSRGNRSGAWSVAPDSTIDDLRRMRGEASISVEPDDGHTFTLDYDFE